MKYYLRKMLELPIYYSSSYTLNIKNMVFSVLENCHIYFQPLNYVIKKSLVSKWFKIFKRKLNKILR